MRYYSAIIFLFVSSIFSVLFLLYFANITRNIEKENFVLLSKIKKLEDQININEIEFSYYNSYEYLIKMHKIYFQIPDKKNLNNRISFHNFKKQNLENLHTVGTK
ncbi:hypothetical protein OAJ30_00895 [Alphaproteobacteria bacterium]|nr:hypothetical protein [Alphaproteobacteria bacterium]